MQNEDKTGEGIYKSVAMPLGEITFDGNKGIFFERSKDAKKDEKTGKYPKTKLTQSDIEPLGLVFLRIRRAIVSFSKTEGFWRTNEHNHKNETVVLYKADGTRETGKASYLREKYPKLHTQQVVYCWEPKQKQIVRLIIKGAALGSDYKHPESMLKFYDYLQSFSKDEHFYEFITNMTPIAEQSTLGDYYAISFSKGEKLSPDEIENNLKMIDEIHDRIMAIDDHLKFKIGKLATTMPEAAAAETLGNQGEIGADELPTIQVADEGDINVEDIPF